VIVENMHDVPWLRPDQLGPETVSAMTVVCSAVRRVHTEFPVGIQILSSGNRAAVAVANAAGDKIFSRAYSKRVFRTNCALRIKKCAPRISSGIYFLSTS